MLLFVLLACLQLAENDDFIVSLWDRVKPQLQVSAIRDFVLARPSVFAFLCFRLIVGVVLGRVSCAIVRSLRSCVCVPAP